MRVCSCQLVGELEYVFVDFICAIPERANNAKQRLVSRIDYLRAHINSTSNLICSQAIRINNKLHIKRMCTTEVDEDYPHNHGQYAF